MIFIYRYIPYLIYIKDRPKTIKLFDTRWQLKVDESDIKKVLTLVDDYLSQVTLHDYRCIYTDCWQYDISELGLRDNLKPYNYRLSVDDVNYLPHYFKSKLEAERFTDSKLQNRGLTYHWLPLYRNPFNKYTGIKL